MAPRVKALVKPELLVWARTSAGFTTVSEAAGKLDVDEARLASWEAGDDAPSIPQLRRMADLYKRPLAVFYLSSVPSNFLVVRDLRRLPGTGLRRIPPDLQFEVRRATERRALALELLDESSETTRTFELTATRDEDPELVGTRVRRALGVTDDDQVRWRDPDGRAAFNAWRSRIEAANVLVFQTTRVSSDEASGFAIAEDLLPVIAVNRKDAPTRRTFSLLHELAHLMLRVSGVSDLDTDASRPPEDQAIEVFCNQAAAATLVPEGRLLNDPRVMQRRRGAIDWTDVEISDLARNFGVSREALLRRLLTFGRTTEAFYRIKRSQYLAEFHAQQQRQKQQTPDDGIPRNMPQETMSNYGRPLVRMVLENYYQNRLTLSEVAGYLGVKAKHIPKIEQMAGMG